MALTITPGGATDDAYYSLSGVQAYWDAVGYDYITDGYTTAQQENAIRRATQWIDGEFGDDFQGTRTGLRTQALMWPRTGHVDYEGNTVSSDEIPVEIEKATAEAAWRELVVPDSLTPDFVRGDQNKIERVAVIMVEKRLAESVSDVKPILTVVNGILFPLLGQAVSTNGTKFLKRA